MEQKIKKKEGVQLAQKQLKAFLNPLGFRLYPHSANRFLRVRDAFIDEISLYIADRKYIKLDYYIHSRFAPFAWLKCDEERLWRTAKKPASDLFWRTDLLLECGLAYFETVWRDVVCALERHILPEMENMTIEAFLSRFVLHSENMQALFLAYETIDLKKTCSVCNSEAAGYGIELWRMGRFDEGALYLNFALQSYRVQLTDCEQEDRVVWHRQFMELALLEELLSLWERKEENWMLAIQQRINQVAVDWIKYI